MLVAFYIFVADITNNDNMFRLDNLLETWAILYRPLSHEKGRDSKHRTFFRISMITENSEFVRNINTTPSPAMAYATHIDAEMAQQTTRAISYRHVIYFMVRQAPGGPSRNLATDEDAATEARFETDQMVQDLLAFLYALKALAGGKTPQDKDVQTILAAAIGAEGAVTADADGTLRVSMADLRFLMGEEMREGLRGMQLDGAHWGTLPVTGPGWQICGLTIEQVNPRQLCIVPERYSYGQWADNYLADLRRRAKEEAEIFGTDSNP